MIDRRRLELIDASVPHQMYHAARDIGLPHAGEAIREAEAVVARVTGTAIGRLVGELGGTGHDVVAAGVPVGGLEIPTGLEKILASHTLLHAAEGDLFAQALVDASNRVGLRVLSFPRAHLFSLAQRRFNQSEEELREILAGLGRAVGPPWRRDEKDATVAAWLALTSATSRRLV